MFPAHNHRLNIPSFPSHHVIMLIWPIMMIVIVIVMMMMMLLDRKDLDGEGLGREEAVH